MALTKQELKQDKRNWWYWIERQNAITDKTIEETQEQLVKYYSASQKKIVGQFEQTYNKVLSNIKDGRAPTPADLYKLDSYWKMQAQLKEELTKLGDKQAELLSKKFVEEWQNIYKAFAIKDDLFFSDVDLNIANQMINQIWCADGKSWSERVWENTSRLQQALNDDLIDCVITGKKPTELKQRLMQDFGVSFNRADTLVRTELAHIQTEAARERYKKAGVTEVEVLADKDERRCDLCGSLHEKRFPINGSMPVPAHPRCRCCILPVVDVELTKEYEKLGYKEESQ